MSLGGLLTPALSGVVFAQQDAPPEKPDYSKKRPLELHEGAQVAGEYRIEWPADLQAETGSDLETERLVVHYTRTEDEGNFEALTNYYGNLARFRRYYFGEGIATSDRTKSNWRWLDSGAVGPAPAPEYSLDVVISQAEPGPRVAREKLIVEILLIEIPELK